MDYLKDFFTNFFLFTNSIAIYIIIGLFIAGILHELLPYDFIKKHLGKGNFKTLIKAAIFGIPLPLCSCSVVPFIGALRKQGANKGAVLTFTIATPITGIDSILATYGIFGLFFTVYRVITSLILALVAGLLSIIFNSKNSKEEMLLKTSCCCSNKSQERKTFSLKRALKYGFETLFKDIAKPLFWGIVIGSLITTLIPQNLETFLRENVLFSYILVLAVAIPMYVCATSSLPIAASLIIAGVPVGAAFVFLTAGPATNAVTIGVVDKILGRRTLFIYLATVIIGSILFGVFLDSIFEVQGINAKEIVHLEEVSNPLKILFTGIFLILLFINLWKIRREKSPKMGS
ncbi:SO_0444 family Cu/Zn efflux transporter [Desulfurobacterium thermolithotrophum]|uniref:SO_0444 family Cu/Zn efflux transporter n=1 Tax=Desulfurobacterium thermolithotrophum TaxID=64160 RepID=UPI0013D30C0F|nr:SO_0444 family Cu/Zn efflux transporter [Desulfurobacterium thermolithotrophum]